MSKAEHTGGSVNYYKVAIFNETTENLQSTAPPDAKYIAECNDIIEALGMNYAEGNVFKELWRTAAVRTLGKRKRGHDALYGAEKVAFFGNRILEQVKHD